MQRREILTSASVSVTRDGRASRKRIRRLGRDHRPRWVVAVRRSMAWKKCMSLLAGILRMAILVIGILLIVVGIPVTPLPIPFGLPMIITGFLMVASVSPGLQRWIRRRREQNPRLEERVHGARTKVPGFIRKLIDLTAPKKKD